MSRAMIDPAPAYDIYGRLTFMVRSGGYVMVKRPRCAPFVMTEKEWRKLPKLASEEREHGESDGKAI